MNQIESTLSQKLFTGTHLHTTSYIWIRKYVVLFMIPRKNASAFLFNFYDWISKNYEKIFQMSKSFNKSICYNCQFKDRFLICIYLLLIKSLFSLAIHRSCSKNCSDRFWIHVTGWIFPLKWYLQFSRAKLFNDRCFKCRQNFFKNNRVRTVKVYVCLQSIALNLYYIEIFFILYYQRK